MFRNSLLKFPVDENESTTWAKLIGLNKILLSSRVSAIHFFEVDIIVKSSSDQPSTFGGIDRIGPTKYQDSDTGNFSLTSPSRPAAPKSNVENSVFYGTTGLTYCDYLLRTEAWSKSKKSSNLKRKESKAAALIESLNSIPSVETFSSFFDTNSVDFKAGRMPEIPFHKNFLGTSIMIILSIKTMHNHGKSCLGNIIIRRSSVFLKKFTLQVTISCSLKCDCGIWDQGLYKWTSSGAIFLPQSSKTAYVPDVLYALACYMTPTTKAHSEQFLSAMLFTPPSHNMLNDLVKCFVQTYLLSEKERIITMRCDKLKSLGVGIIVDMDVGYTGAPKAQCATVMVGSGSRAPFSRVDTENGAWLKEGILVSLALDEAINQRKLDIVVVEIDNNAANKKKVESYKRINGPIEYSQQTVKGLNDVFHAAKSMGRQAFKITSVCIQQLESKIKPLTASQPADWNIEIDLLQPILLTLEENFHYYFHDISEKSESIGAKEWIEADSTKTSMQEFAKKINLVDGTIDYEFWVPIVEVWNNLKPPSAAKAENINSVIITKITSLRCLTALADAVSSLLQVVALIDINKNTVLGHSKSHLPAICFRGDNFSVNFVDYLDDNVTKSKLNINQSIKVKRQKCNDRRNIRK